MNNFSNNDNAQLVNEFGSVSFDKFYSIISSIKNGVLVDIGVYEGASSKMMLNHAIENNNKIYAIDPIPYFYSNNPNYNFIKEDSVFVGQNWNNGPVDLVFFDSVHAKEQVLCELYYWWDKIKVGGYAIFHDTSWEGYIHKEGHSCAGKLTGNTGMGYDSFGGINWETPDKAIESFFNIKINTKERDISNSKFVINYEDDHIVVQTNYADLGMTIIYKKYQIDYKSNISNWEEIFKKREILLAFFKNSNISEKHKPSIFKYIKYLIDKFI